MKGKDDKALYDYLVAEKHFDKLLDIHHLIQHEGYLDVPFHMFIFIARKG